MKIAVVGSINMDMGVHTSRIPLSGETLMGSSISYSAGGKGANQAYAAARFGVGVSMFGCVGDDDNGRTLIAKMESVGIDTHGINIIEGETTGLAIITIGSGDNTIIVVPGANGRVDKTYIDSVKQEILQHDIIVLQQEIPSETVAYVIEFCNQAGKIIILNPAPATEVPLDLVQKVNYITPNEHEAKIIFGGETVNVEEMLRRYPEKLLITMGEKGVALCTKSGHVKLIPTREASVVDTTGAGDTFNGIFAAMLAKGELLEQALLYANTGASMSTEKRGAQGGMPVFMDVEREVELGKEEVH